MKRATLLALLFIFPCSVQAITRFRLAPVSLPGRVVAPSDDGTSVILTTTSDEQRQLWQFVDSKMSVIVNFAVNGFLSCANNQMSFSSEEEAGATETWTIDADSQTLSCNGQLLSVNKADNTLVFVAPGEKVKKSQKFVPLDAQSGKTLSPADFDIPKDETETGKKEEKDVNAPVNEYDDGMSDPTLLVLIESKKKELEKVQKDIVTVKGKILELHDEGYTLTKSIEKRSVNDHFSPFSILYLALMK